MNPDSAKKKKGKNKTRAQNISKDFNFARYFCGSLKISYRFLNFCITSG